MTRESYRLRERLFFPHRFFLFATTMGCVLGTLGNRPDPKTYFPSKPAYVPLRQPAASENTSLRVLLETYCPSLFSPFCPSWWLFRRVHTQIFSGNVLTQCSGHLQTLYAIVGDFSSVDMLAYDRCVVLLPCRPRYR